MYTSSMWLFFVQKEGFFAGCASKRTTAKSRASTQIRPWYRNFGKMLNYDFVAQSAEEVQELKTLRP